MQQLVSPGDRLVSISFPGEDLGKDTYKVGRHKVASIGVHELPGIGGMYLVANVTFEDDRADLIAPLHALLRFEVLNPF